MSRIRDRLALLNDRPLQDRAAVVGGAVARRLQAVARRGTDPGTRPGVADRPDPRWVRRPGLKVAGVLDPFSQVAFRYEFDLHHLEAGTWRGQVEELQPDLLLVESVWAGPAGTWRSMIARLDEPHPNVIELVDWFRDHDLPTVFWNKEDPPNYLWFIETAKIFDHVFTVDEGSLDRYRKDLGHRRVDVLPFAAQPRVHTPVMAEPDLRDAGTVAFAGTYFRRKYPERRHQMEAMLEPAREFGLTIYSRVIGDPANRWPRKYQPHVVGSLEYREMLEAYKRHQVFLNVGSVAHSTTMCPRRVFELLASGTTVLSWDLAGLRFLDPDSAVVERSQSPQETRSRLSELLHGPRGDVVSKRRTALRSVHRGHTYADRVDHMLGVVRGDPPVTRPRAAALLYLEDRDPTERSLEAIAGWTQDPRVGELHLGGPGGARSDLQASGPRVVRSGSDLELSSWLERSLSRVGTELVLRASQDLYPGAQFLEDALAAFEYSNATAVGPPLAPIDPVAQGRALYREGDLDPAHSVWRTDRARSSLGSRTSEACTAFSAVSAGGISGLVVPLEYGPLTEG